MAAVDALPLLAVYRRRHLAEPVILIPRLAARATVRERHHLPVVPAHRLIAAGGVLYPCR